MTKEQALKEMKECVEISHKDVEEAHWRADTILCKLLNVLDCRDVVCEWEKVRKWYA